MSDASERTEQATAKHLREAREQGRIQKSADVGAWTSLGAATFMVPLTITRVYASLQQQIMTIGQVIRDPEPALAVAALRNGLVSVGSAIWPLLATIVVVVIAANIIQGGLHLRKFTPRFQQFNLIKGIGHMFGTRVMWETVKSLAKTAAVGLSLWLIISGLIGIVQSMGALSTPALLNSAKGGIAELLGISIGAGILFAAVDILVVRQRNQKSTRMTKREVKDEMKNTEGDPMVRAQRRSRRMALSRSRMIQAVADADVVLVNPTHVAVALRYEAGKSAPRVVAKGADNIATRIREEAREKNVPMVADVPLARALYKQCKLGQEIPAEFFTQVARILAFVMALRKRGANLAEAYTVPTQR